MTTPGRDDSFGPKPTTVSSMSSMETLQNEPCNFVGSSHSLSAEPSLIRSIPNASQLAGASNYGNLSNFTTSMPSSISLVRNPLRSPSTGVVIPSVASPNAVPEFLYQLTKMLTDNNRDIIEWSNGKIEVHNPHKLQIHVLNRYFRHSKFASFQRQLNYFGFRKLAGKGKMAPCSYVNDATTNELRSLLHIKRKTGNEPKSKAAEARGAQNDTSVDRTLSRILYRSGDSANTIDSRGIQPQHSQQALARVAVGKGIRHSFACPRKDNSIHNPIGASDSSMMNSTAPSPVQAGLSALTSNFKNSFLQENDAESATSSIFQLNQSGGAQPSTSSLEHVPGSLRRDDSLVDLAMIPLLEGDPLVDPIPSSTGLTFIDFPWDPSYLETTDIP